MSHTINDTAGYQSPPVSNGDVAGKCLLKFHEQAKPPPHHPMLKFNIKPLRKKVIHITRKAAIAKGLRRLTAAKRYCIWFLKDTDTKGALFV